MEMETSYLTVDFFRRLPGLEDVDDMGAGKGGKGGGAGGGGGKGLPKDRPVAGGAREAGRMSTGADRYQEMHFRRIGEGGGGGSG